VDRLRVFAGYAGWEGGQLERELAEGAWYVLDADPEDALTSEPGGLWRFVLRRQGGKLALVSNFPADPTMN
jgi:putative transcriptional regulator